MGTVRDRPTLLQRFPNGVKGKSFFQKRIPDNAPEWLQTTIVSTPNGTESRAIVMADLAHVLWAVNQGCLGFHPWPIRTSEPESCDELRLDLDPSPGVDFEMVREAAAEVRDFLGEVGITAFPKTTGNRGLHLYARVEPGWTSYGVRQAAVAVARSMEERRPDLITGAWWKEERGTRVFVDFNQNAPHKTVFGAWCIRSRVGGQVSMPFRWDDLATIDHDAWTIATVPGRLEARRRSMGWDGRLAAVDRAPRRSLSGRSRPRHPGRTLAARLSQDARRSSAGRPEPGQEGVQASPNQRFGDAGGSGRQARSRSPNEYLLLMARRAHRRIVSSSRSGGPHELHHFPVHVHARSHDRTDRRCPSRSDRRPAACGRRDRRRSGDRSIAASAGVPALLPRSLPDERRPCR